MLREQYLTLMANMLIPKLLVRNCNCLSGFTPISAGASYSEGCVITSLWLVGHEFITYPCMSCPHERFLLLQVEAVEQV